MNSKQIKLAREQLDERLKKFKPLAEVIPPVKGWIRAIRDALGMTGKQLAKRLNVNQSRIVRIEHDETLGKVKLETLQKVAQALDCKFVYGFVPNQSLEKTVQTQAHLVAQKQMADTNQMMRLEMQELSDKEKAKAMKDLTSDITSTMQPTFWDEK